MDAELRAQAARQGGVFSAGQARAVGLAIDEVQWLVRSGRWVRVRRGVYVERELLNSLADLPRERHLLECAAVRLVLDRPFVLNLWSAVRVHQLRTLLPLPDTVCGVDEREARSGKGYLISGATLPAHHVTTVDGWAVTTGGRTVVDAARHLSFMAAVVLADSALQSGITSPAELAEVALACAHYEGIGAAARACTFADGGAESVLESQSRVVLVARGLPRPVLQAAIYDRDGFVGRTDMLWAREGVVGEVDGKVKYTDPYADRPVGELLWAEKLRTSRLEAAGLEVVRWTAEELRREPDRIVARVRAAAVRARSNDVAYRVVPAARLLDAS